MEIIKIGESAIKNEIENSNDLLDKIYNNFLNNIEKTVKKFKKYLLKIKVNKIIILNPINTKNGILAIHTLLINNAVQYMGLLHKHYLIKVGFA